MEDLLILKYPNKAEDIRWNREQGYSDDEIDSEYKRRWHINLYNGYSTGEIEQAYGVSRESKKRYLSAVKNERKRVMSEAFEISPKDLEETTQMANNLGVNPWVFLGNRDVYKTQMAKLEEEKEWARPKGDGLPQQDLAKVSQGNRLPQFGDTYTNLDAWMYPFARFVSQLERYGMGVAGLPGEVAEGAVDVASKVGVTVSPEAKEMLRTWNNALRETPNFGIAAPWVAEKGAMRRQALAERWGMVGTIAANISDTIYDYSALYAVMTTIGTVLGGPAGGLAGAGSVYAAGKLTHVLAKIARTAKLQGTMGFLTTPGDIQDRLQAGAYRVAYNLTPYIANAIGAVGMEAVFADYFLNTALSSPAYYNAIKENGLNRDTVSSLVVQNTMDFLMAWGTRGDPAQIRRVAQDRHIARMALESNLPESTVRDIAELNIKVAEEMFWRNEPVEVKSEGGKEGEAPTRVKAKVDKDGLVKTTEGKGNTLDATQPETARAILEEVVKDPNVKGQDRERVMKALKDDTPYVDLETMDSLPILDAVSRLGGGRVKVNLPPVEDMPLTTLLRVRGDDGGVKKEVSKLIKEIGEGTGTRVAWEEKKAVQEILEKLDLKHRSRFTMEQRAIVEDIVKDDPEAVEFLNKIDLAGLGKTTLNDMTLRELRDLHAQVKELTLIGISKTDEREIAEKKELDGTVREVRREIIEGSKEGEKVRPDFVTSREDVQGRNVGIVEGFLAHSKTMNRVFDAMSGYKGFVNPSKFVDFMWGRVNKNEDTKLTHLNNRRNFVIDDMNVKGIKPQDLAGKVIVEGGGKTKEYLIGEMMGVYAHSLVPFQRRGLIDLNGFTNEHIDAVVAQLKALDKDYIGLTHTIIKDFKDNFARVNDANIRYMNVGLDEIENYTPIHWLFRESGSKGFVDDYKDSIDQQYKALNIMKKNYARHGFSNQRVDNYSENMRGAYDLNLFSVWGKAIAEQEHFAAHGGHVRDMHRLMDSKDDLGIPFKEIIRNTWGKPYEKMIEEYINRIANPSIYTAMSYVENGLQVMKHNIALAYLSYNVITMLKQAPSIALYMGEAGPVELFAAIARATSGGFGEMLRNAERYDPQIKNRGIDQAYMELQKTLENRNDWKAKIGNKGMLGIKAIDKVVVTIGWNAVFNAYKSKGYTDAEAARIAQTVTLNTQPAAHAKDLAAMYATGNPAINMLLMFTNQLNKIWGITTHDFKGYAKRGEYDKAFLQAIGMGMSAMMIYALSGNLPSDEEDPNFAIWMAKAMGGQIGSAVPLVGREVVSAFDGYFGGELPLFKTATGMARGTKGVLQSAMGQKEWSRADAYKIWEAFALLKGLPYTQGKRVVESVVNQNPAELVGRKTPKKPKFKYSSQRTQW